MKTMLEFAQLCDYLTPTTLAQIINDLDDAVSLPPCSGLDVVAMRKVAADALDANIGEDEAARLIEKLRR